jgi:hypothetical protein
MRLEGLGAAHQGMLVTLARVVVAVKDGFAVKGYCQPLVGWCRWSVSEESGLVQDAGVVRHCYKVGFLLPFLFFCRSTCLAMLGSDRRLVSNAPVF